METTRIGRYQIESELGRGAMAVVYKAVDPLIGRIVAIKTIRLESVTGMGRKELLDRFYREARSAGNLSHPNIVTIFDIGEESGVSYIAMEFVEGESLEDWMEKNPLPSVERSIAIVEQVAAGLDYASARGIIHRDIKPGNILLTQDLKAKISDFGIAKLSTSNLTQTGAVIGTPAYMSPEQAMGTALDGRSDIFSLGVIFYQLLTGERPFTGTSPTTIIYKILHEEPVPPCKLNVTLHPGLDQIVRRMLAKDPTKRYQTCGELVRDLNSYSILKIEGETAAQPTVGRPPAVQAERAKPASGYRLTILALSILLLMVSALLSFLYYRHVRRGPASTPSGADRTAPVSPRIQNLPQPSPKVAEKEVGPRAGEAAPSAKQAVKPEEPALTPAVPSVAPAQKTPAAGKKDASLKAETPPPEKPAGARVRFEFSGASYVASVYEGSRKLGNVISGPLSILVAPGTHQFRVVSEEVYLDRRLERVQLKSDQAHSISLPGLSSAYLEVPDDAFEGCEISLNGQTVPTPYPAQIPKLAAGDVKVVFRWASGRYAGTEVSEILSCLESRLYRVRGEPGAGRVVVQQVR